MANDLIHILLIEDSPGSQALLRESLSAAAMPFKITCACSLAEAQRVATADAFNLIMLDLSLPDGREPGTVKAAIDAFSSLPIIVLTELSADEIGPDAVRAGAQDYLLRRR
jgi:DNA-binding response OmpR family regulator